MANIEYKEYGVSELYDYPITITSTDFKRNIGVDLAAKVKGDDVGLAVTAFLNTVHSHIYDYLIYSSGKKGWKDRIIEKYKAELERPIKRALVMQADYLLTNNSNIGMWNGVVISAGGSADIKDTQDILTKIICPEVYNVLMAAEPNILYAGG